MQWGFCKYVLSKKMNTDIVYKSASANRELIVIIYSSPQTSNMYFKLEA